MFHLVVSAIVKQDVFEQTSWSFDCSCVSSANCLSDRRRLLRRAAMDPDPNASATATMDPDPNDEDSALLKKYPKCAWCITCRSVKLHLSHFSTAKKHGKRKEPVTASELKEYLAKTRQTGGSKKRGGQESVRHPTVLAQQEESATGGGSSSQVLAPYCFEFGKYKKQPVKPLDQVLQDDPGYVQWAIQSKVHHQRPNFAQALLDRGLIESLPGPAQPQSTVAAPDPEIDGQVAGVQDVSNVALVADPPKRRRKFVRLQQIVIPHHCQQCGSKHHNISTFCYGLHHYNC